MVAFSFQGFPFTTCSFYFSLKFDVFWLIFVGFLFVFNHFATELGLFELGRSVFGFFFNLWEESAIYLGRCLFLPG